MENESPQPATGNEPSFPIQTQHSPRNTVFSNERGLRAGWRIVIYIVLVIFFSMAINLVLDKIFHVPKTRNPAPWQTLLQESLLLILVFLPARFMAWVERRSVGAYGLPVRAMFGRQFWQGCALGVAEISILMGCIAIFGGYSF